MPPSGRSRPKTKVPPGKRAAKGKDAGKGAGSGAAGGRVTPKGSGRYTPPIPKEHKVSPPWVPVLMFTLLLLGLVVIVCNYLGVLPGEANNGYLFAGLGLITGGFITATRYR
ncbi:MAG: cell division protein CrgA [Actinomycetota bacterium]|nr:cell division protein CrgA [Actinomycetota bacterium]